MRTRSWWLIPEVAAMALLVLAAPFVPPAGPSPDLADRAARILEAASPAEHHAHGHEVVVGERVFCGVDVFGTDDTGNIVYGYYFCAIGAPGTPYLESNRSDGPVIVRLTGAPAVTIAYSGAGYADRVRAMMPDQYESLCFGGLRDDRVAADVKRRYEAMT